MRYRCATVNKDELTQLRRIKNVIRLGRVVEIGQGEVQFERGAQTSHVGTLYVDCTADGLKRSPAQPVFQEHRIVLQPVLACQPAFSAAMIALVEAKVRALEKQNELCRPTQYPVIPKDYFTLALNTVLNVDRWTWAFGWKFLRMRLYLGAHVPPQWLPMLLLRVFMAKRGALKTLRQFVSEADGSS